MAGTVVLASKPEWGNLDILEACGASDSGSNPGSGACINSILLPFA